jgi:purine-nucleoside phosphorylase
VSARPYGATEESKKNLMPNNQELQSAVDFIRSRTSFRPTAAVLLGSGLGNLADCVQPEIVLSAVDIPYYPVSSVPGHAGKLIFGFLQNGEKTSPPLLMFKGRTHFYESGDLNKVIFPVHIAGKLGVHSLFVTNAAGGINKSFKIGDLMLIRETINFAFVRALSRSEENGMYTHAPSDYFDARLQNIIRRSSLFSGIHLQEGTYCWLQGPSYETAAEIQMLKILGADAAGMSTVPEITAARQLGMKAAAISLISNLAAGISQSKLSHSEVTETANRIEEKFVLLMKTILTSLS